jgi:hypothetical protein
VDEVSFGSRRESRLPARYRRALAAVAAASVVTTAGVLAVAKITTMDQAASPPRAVKSQPACPPVQTTKPNLAGLPAGMRPGALQVIVTAQFSGQCGASQ